MATIDLLDAVLPTEGWYAVVGIKGKSVKQELVETREELDAIAEKYVEENRNVFFGCSKYKTGDNRRKENVLSIRSFWLDIDCGYGKEEINPLTNHPFGYVDQPTGMAELRRFTDLIGLPKPVVVDSGRGLHVYWKLDEPITRQEWEPMAARLGELCIIHNFYVDASVFEPSRVLRIPGTFNFKEAEPLEVNFLFDGESIPASDMRKLLGVKAIVPRLDFNFAPSEPNELTLAAMGSTVQKFKNIMVRGEHGCQQLNYAFTNQADIPEPLWWSALTVANECLDRQKAIHMMSSQHPDYDPVATERKAGQGGEQGGPHRCATFDKHNPGGCNGCKWKGKIAGPIALSKEVVEEEIEEVEEGEVDNTPVEPKIPKYPAPYKNGPNNAIYLDVSKDEAEPVCVYEHPLYVVKRMTDPNDGEVALMRLHLPHDGIKEFTVPLAVIAVKDELRKYLAKQGVAGTIAQMNHLATYVLTYVKNLQYKRRAEVMRTQFGWAENNSKFIIGDREISKDGVYGSPSSSTTKALAALMQPVGSYELWREAFNMYARPGLEPHAFAALTAFGAPLFKFTGLKGAILNVIYKHGGSGKSTTLFMCNSVYGNPEPLCSLPKDTVNAKMMRLGILNNLPYAVDEITSITAEDFSDLAYSMSQGRGKDRMKGSTNELRDNSTTWQTMSLASSNASFYEKLGNSKSGANAEMLRLFEYEIAPSDVISTEEGKRMFDHQLKNNYGHAGEIYATWLVNNLEEAVRSIINIQAKIDKELRLTPPERFWSAAAACNITGGLIAKNLGLHDYDMKAIYAWVTKTIMGMREEIKPPSDDITSVVGDYINRHMQSILVVKADKDNRTTVASLPTLEPRGELLIRYEPDTKIMYLVTREFKADCIDRQINYKDTLHQLKLKGVFAGTMNKRMSKGMKITSPAVHVLMFDCSKSGFLDMDDIVGVEAESASRDD